MKKMVLALLAAGALTATAAHAQTGITFGPKASLNVAGLTGASNTSSRAGLAVGGFAEFRLGSIIGIQPELMFSMQGARAKEVVGHAGLHLGYLNIPVLAKFYVFRSLSIDLGPQVGFMLNSKVHHSDSGETEKISGTHSTDLSIAVGVSYTFFKRLMVSARYNIGTTKVFTEGNNKNGVFQLGAAWRFGIGR